MVTISVSCDLPLDRCLCSAEPDAPDEPAWTGAQKLMQQCKLQCTSYVILVTFSGVQCLAPWLSGMVDPGLVQSELTALNAELTASAKPALAAFSVHITTLVVRSGAFCMCAVGQHLSPLHREHIHFCKCSNCCFF